MRCELVEGREWNAAASDLENNLCCWNGMPKISPVGQLHLLCCSHWGRIVKSCCLLGFFLCDLHTLSQPMPILEGMSLWYSPILHHLCILHSAMPSLQYHLPTVLRMHKGEVVPGRCKQVSACSSNSPFLLLWTWRVFSCILHGMLSSHVLSRLIYHCRVPAATSLPHVCQIGLRPHWAFEGMTLYPLWPLQVPLGVHITPIDNCSCKVAFGNTFCNAINLV